MLRGSWGACALLCVLGACVTSDGSTGDDGVATADQALTGDGPFSTRGDLANYWNNTSTGGAATEIFVNGHREVFRAGFGPEFLKQYFVCGDGFIYPTCPSGFYDGFETLEALVDRSPPAASITLDGHTIRTGSNGSKHEEIKTCAVDTSINGAVYYKVVLYDGGGMVYTSDCY